MGEDEGLRPRLNLGTVAMDGGGEVEEESKGVLGDGGGGVACHVADGDVVLGRSFELDVVEARGGD